MDEAALWDLMNAAWDRMTFRQKHLWETIRIDPQKWEQHPYGIGNGGFWVVALIGRTVLWYNDLEYGFQRSSYVRHGEINEFGSNQFELEVALQYVLNEIDTGR